MEDPVRVGGRQSLVGEVCTLELASSLEGVKDKLNREVARKSWTSVRFHGSHFVLAHAAPYHGRYDHFPLAFMRKSLQVDGGSLPFPPSQQRLKNPN